MIQVHLSRACFHDTKCVRYRCAFCPKTSDPSSKWPAAYSGRSMKQRKNKDEDEREIKERGEK